MVSLVARAKQDAASLHLLKVTRDDERIIRELELSLTQLRQLADDNLGIFAGGLEQTGMMERQLVTFAKSASARTWIAAVSSKKLLADLQLRLNDEESYNVNIRSKGTTGFVIDNLFVTTVEGLRRTKFEQLDGVFLYDPICHIHKARNFQRFDGNNHDRPQIVANFLSLHRQRGNSPVLCLMTRKAAKSVSTSAIANAYMQEGWWFAYPRSLRFTDT